MRRRDSAEVFLAAIIIFALILSGCGLLSKPAPKMEEEPAEGMLGDRAFLERFSPAPGEFYELDESAAALFVALSENDWASAGQLLAKMQNTWQEIRPGAALKAESAGSAALNKLTEALTAQNVSDACQNLNRFMANLSKISKDYYLSPVSDIINVGIVVREAGFYATGENWGKASAKLKQMETVWNQSKPALEQVGVMGRLTKAHALINQMKDAIDAENKDAFAGHWEEVDETFGDIRKFYYGK